MFPTWQGSRAPRSRADGMLSRSFDEGDMTAIAGDERLPARRASLWMFANDGGGMRNCLFT